MSTSTPRFRVIVAPVARGKPDNSRELVDATRPFQVRASINIKDRWRACGSAADFVIESISKGAL
jgi:hypothetical protein